ncbi:MAG TPA: HNH endonuclease [Polyangiaceae bacterium]|nr:HNH endonuclease [Polyangiaceae bacterium]
MHADSELVQDRIAPLLRSPPSRLGRLSDTELLATAQRLAGTSNQVFSALLEHLAEVDVRGLHRLRACSSLYTYCVYELRFSEDAAARRSAAAKLVRRFPAILGAVAAGEIHLTGLLMLGPHLTEENHAEVLGRAKFRTKKEIATLVRRLAPLPAVPDRVEPLGPAPLGTPRDPTWAELVESLCPPVRTLPAGERPCDWVNESERVQVSKNDGTQFMAAEIAEIAELAAPARLDEPPPLYQMQFTTTAEHAELLARAKSLLSHRSPKVRIGDVHLQAMRLLVEALEKQRYGSKNEADIAPERPSTDGREEPTKNSRTRDDGEAPRRRGRYVPANLRRAVLERDERQCAYLDERGVRCRETERLEIHHLEPFARGGGQRLENLSLRCRAHNTLAAEQDFGRKHIARRRDGCRHESLRRAFENAEQSRGSAF